MYFACGKTVTLDMNALLKDALPARKGGGNKRVHAAAKSGYARGRVLNQLVSSLQSAV